MSESLQGEFDLTDIAPCSTPDQLSAIDLFAGIGGLSAGFQRAGFSMTGVEKEPIAAETYKRAGFGSVEIRDLASELCLMDVPVVVGGPPCRPWSAVNLQRRRSAHQDHVLLDRFIEHVLEIRPEVFVMENVLALGSDDLYLTGMKRLKAEPLRYSIERRIIQYDRYGASTRRRRLFTIGVKNSSNGAARIFELMEEHRRPGSTVEDAIGWLRDIPRGEVDDHDWSELRSIHKYADRYATGQYGWAKLRYDKPAPSFGSVAKTYILHPQAGDPGYPERVISVREALCIMGFGRETSFPAGAPRALRYQMAANAVSPDVAEAVGQAVRSFLLT